LGLPGRSDGDTVPRLAVNDEHPAIDAADLQMGSGHPVGADVDPDGTQSTPSGVAVVRVPSHHAIPVQDESRIVFEYNVFELPVDLNRRVLEWRLSADRWADCERGDGQFHGGRFGVRRGDLVRCEGEGPASDRPPDDGHGRQTRRGEQPAEHHPADLAYPQAQGTEHRGRHRKRGAEAHVLQAHVLALRVGWRQLETQREHGRRVAHLAHRVDGHRRQQDRNSGPRRQVRRHRHAHAGD